MNNNINDIVDYIINRFERGGKNELTMLKLQKLLYYAQAWYLVNKGKNKRLFIGKFEAWVHGPVNREIFNRFKETHSLYSLAQKNDILHTFNINNIPEEDIDFINDFLDNFGEFSGADLERMSHSEKPWQEARGDLHILESCSTEIDEETMGKFYEKKLIESGKRKIEEALWQ